MYSRESVDILGAYRDKYIGADIGEISRKTMIRKFPGRLRGVFRYDRCWRSWALSSRRVHAPHAWLSIRKAAVTVCSEASGVRCSAERTLAPDDRSSIARAGSNTRTRLVVESFVVLMDAYAFISNHLQLAPQVDPRTASRWPMTMRPRDGCACSLCGKQRRPPSMRSGSAA